MLVESSLQTLVRLICRIDTTAVDLPSRESWVTQLLAAGHRPLGNWLDEVRQASDCENLAVRAQCLLRTDARHHDRTISHDLLKQWSSSKNAVMPQLAVKPVLRGLRLTRNKTRTC